MIKILLIIPLLILSGCTKYLIVFGCSPGAFVLSCTVVIELMLLYILMCQNLGTELTKRNLMLYHVTRGE